MIISLYVLSFINLKEYKHLELKFLFYIFQLAYITVTILTYNDISSILVLVTSSMTLDLCMVYKYSTNENNRHN